MKVVILAGGYGTRLSEETHLKPKPMVEIGGKPVLWHILKIYSSYGFNDFIICLGYKGHVIKEYFNNYYVQNSNLIFDFTKQSHPFYLQSMAEQWKVTLVDTGDNVMTGGRLKRIQPYIGNEPFMLTYGDGLADIDLLKLRDFHNTHKKLATVTSIQPAGRFGVLELGSDSQVNGFQEKPKGGNQWINGGFFIMQPQVFDYILGGDQMVLEEEPLRNLAKDGQLMAYKHFGFWHPMDTLRDRNVLEDYWKTGKAPWKKWDR
ncbi:glucose-1-phosphate cytidylyltransferase [Gracilibacillus sp. JCM 18860]|uniref:glucose-1-phosphate cytidylyltransferase n=1 Tax=Gracilibacillus sp. JCM 18860 TaxID=1306159 RepID=UPI0006D1C5D5